MKSAGLSPKVPVQAIVTAVVAALAYFGVDLDPEVAGAIGVVLGFVAGYIAPPAPVVPDNQAGQSIIELVVVVLVILILVFVLLRVA